jgi:hypothetical protein
MRFLHRGRVLIGSILFLAACQGNMATPPVTPQGQYAPGGQLGAASAIRGQSVSAAATATLEPDTPALDFPPIAGFGLIVQLHSPSPTPTPRSAAAASRLARKKNPHGAPSPAPTPTVTPSPEVTASPSPTITAPPPNRKHHGGAPVVPTHQVSLTFTVYPEAAPPAPTAPPSTQPVLQRRPLLLGNLHAEDAVTLPSLSALSFTLAKREQLAGRGFTVAIFEERKHRKVAQIAFDKDAVMSAAGVVRSALSSLPIPLEADHRYAFVLYADEPAPIAASALPAVTPAPTGLSPTPSPSSLGGVFSGSTLQGGTPH